MSMFVDTRVSKHTRERSFTDKMHIGEYCLNLSTWIKKHIYIWLPPCAYESIFELLKYVLVCISSS